MKAPSFVWMIIAGCVLVFLLALNSYLTFINIAQLNIDAGWVEHSYKVLNGLDRVMSIATEVESAGRGYMITGDEQFLDQYSAGISSVDAKVTEIEKLTADNQEQQARVSELRQRANERMRILTEAVETRQTGGIEAVRSTMGTNRGKIAMDRLRETVGQMQESEYRLLDQRAKRSVQTYWTAIVTEIGAGLVAIAAVIGFFTLLRQFLRSRVESALVIAEQAERLRTTLASIGDAVITTDTEGRITNMNAVAESLTAWTTDEASAQPLEDVFRIINETTREVVESPVAKSLREGSIVGLANHTILIAKDGTEWPIDDSAAPIRCKEGEIVGCVLVFREISKRKEAEGQLLENAKRLRQLADAMPQIVWAAKPDGTLDYYNWRWYEYVGLSPERMDDARWDLYIHPNDLPRAHEKWAESVASGEPYGLEFRVRNHEDNYRWFLARALPVRNELGKIVRWYGSCTDIHEEVERENELRNVAARLSDADRRKNEFLAMLAHELRNPLAPIRNALQIIRLTSPQSGDLHSATTMMDRQVGQLVRLVDDLLDISRISSGKIELRKERIDLNRVIATTVEAARPEFTRKRVDLRVQTGSQPIYMFGDPARLGQTIGNLLNNAVKFTNGGGSVTVSTEIADEKVVLKVKDDGIGIAGDQLPYIFDLFVQVDTSLERSTSGLGIGLSLVKKLIEMHGGEVEANSDGPGHGTEFVLTLPLSAEGEHSKTDRDGFTSSLAAKATRRVLVVDDNADSAESLKLLLEIAGHEVYVARDGVEALEKAGEVRPEVILLDIGLPRLNGYEAARAIRQRDWGKAITLIALTGWGQKEDRDRSKAAGFDLHMVKPVDHMELLKFLDDSAIQN